MSVHIFLTMIKKMYNIENRRYTGNKNSLADWIIYSIKKECKGDSFADIFAGTGSLIPKLGGVCKKIIINDLLYSNNVIYKAFFEKGRLDEKKLLMLKEKYDNLNTCDIADNYIFEKFGGKYFSYNDAKKIGYIREDIEINRDNLTHKEYNVLVASLLYSLDKVSNTVGHYEAYFKDKMLSDKFIFNFINTVHLENVEIHREDANTLVHNIKADIVYVDPPYNSRQYSRFYHVLETIVKWDKPELYGTAQKPKAENMSDYCRTNAKYKFADLIKNLNCSYIVVSYNNTYTSKSSASKNKITLNEIRNTLIKKGTLKEYSKSHKFFNSGKTDFKNHKEYLFIVKVT